MIEHIFLLIGIIATFILYKYDKKCKFDMKFNESLLFTFSLILFAISILIDYGFVKVKMDMLVVLYISIYFLLLVVIHYILRIVKLKKYIPSKIIIGYIIISIFINILYLLLFVVFNNYINDGFGIVIFFVLLNLMIVCFIGLLLLINIILFIIGSIQNNRDGYINRKYNITKLNFFNFIVNLLLLSSVIGLNVYNNIEYNKLLERQKNIVINHLNKKYPNSDYKIKKTYEQGVDCFFLSCSITVFRNEIEIKNIDDIFLVDINKEDLSIYYSGLEKDFFYKD